ncbi:tRNA pseudouridine(55) synthase TruB [Porphyromonas crevioricanis]|uniref:tRNA pseudouridine synthase B n=2 Tax=Porphyromonas crevioricanis TaxID=393921 RepID=A0A2X4PHS7_9PORP|nr:tRNA pseudouridine(55) synthase TruB [Porphyromonas crevioricanis]GAD04884.1 tRNA pseudouridine synthase B [Porphyromonas crevioricanis JCM 15906]GAD06820.1 tRNA pseudouridine synthase B [Porphyromonas crevioricanis JCM 13913]SJZ73564.1 tRNA pseudouridine55 synthase [Porphyromonas crevioricanis]SQH73486.1 tRNA pseudouridine synthase B [Porphyromonas crevioricanis]
MDNIKDRKWHLTEDGEVLLFDKPYRWTSFDLVNKFRYWACRRLGVKKLKVGHAGTLDPLATGLMIICTGRCTKQLDTLQQGKKEYIATLKLGQTTPSFDLETEPDAEYPTEHITEQLISEVLPKFVGIIEQTPPAYSAIRVDGKRAYALARKGREVNLKPRLLVVEEIELLSTDLPEIIIRVVCSKGTYIRALARDIGVALGSGAHLTALRRTRIGEYRIEDAYPIELLDELLKRYVEPLPKEEKDGK